MRGGWGMRWVTPAHSVMLLRLRVKIGVWYPTLAAVGVRGFHHACACRGAAAPAALTYSALGVDARHYRRAVVGLGSGLLEVIPELHFFSPSVLGWLAPQY